MGRSARRGPPLLCLLLLPLALALAGVPTTAGAQTPPDWDLAAGHFFTQTGGGGAKGYAVTDEGGVRFWSEFRRLGGVQTVGYPASQRFQWDGFTVQAFQRVIFQWRPESGSVAFVNVFDRLHELGKDDWLRSVRATPPPRTFDDAGKSWDAIARAHLSVLQHYPDLGNAYYAVAGDPIQANGLPMSDVIDVGNALVLRCQRVVFQEWKVDVPWAKATQVTIALGGDIAKEAGILPDAAALLPTTPPGAASPAAAGSSTATPTATSGKIIVLDPGHGGFEIGAARSIGPRLAEKDVNLDVGLRLAEKLRAAGHRVVLTRDTDSQVNTAGRDLNGDGRVDVDDDLQARVDVANDAHADLFISLHANGGTSTMRGLSTFYCAACDSAPTGRRLAADLHRATLAALAPLGAGEFGAGIFDESGLGKPYGHLFVIGPRTPRVARPNGAAAQALIELLFVSNADDAALLARADVRDLIAGALRDGIQDFVAGR